MYRASLLAFMTLGFSPARYSHNENVANYILLSYQIKNEFSGIS
jgi:hypothetical protein